MKKLLLCLLAGIVALPSLPAQMPPSKKATVTRKPHTRLQPRRKGAKNKVKEIQKSDGMLDMPFKCPKALAHL